MNKTDLTTAFEQTSFLYGGNAQFIEELYAKYLENPAAVDQHWRQFFAGLDDDPASAKRRYGPRGSATTGRRRQPANSSPPSTATGRQLNKPSAPRSRPRPRPTGARPFGRGSAQGDDGFGARADDDPRLPHARPSGRRSRSAEAKRPAHPELDPASYGFSEADLDRPIFLDKVLGLEQATMRQIVDILRRTYCDTLGVEFMHISDPEQKAWIQERIEGADKEITFTLEGKKAILAKLIEAEGFENFLNVKYTGTKRFGLDGGESMIPALEQIIKRGGQLGVQEIVLGMAHRGRLNVLANVMAKPFSAIFHEFKGGSSTPDEVEGSGDVKYHLGSSSDREFDGNTVHLSLTANPSHLEIVDPVVLGKARAKQDQRGDKERNSVLPLLIHGDAAFAGQGVVAECFGLVGPARPPLRRLHPFHRQQPDRLHHQPAFGRGPRPIPPTSPR